MNTKDCIDMKTSKAFFYIKEVKENRKTLFLTEQK